MHPLKLYKKMVNIDRIFAIFDSGPGHLMEGTPKVSLPLILTMVISSLDPENPLSIDRVNTHPG
ncbi:MAG: hypothetical protein JAY85_09760 [Candidatus Thiodiazotropha weberae]|uniref:Uncharacterized protein n=1 Tax=Candidatus Thiodiazotropha endoloripes TaxID=1818881 RepID=A0A1E2UIH6_9GAMM|nr:hypothetical protein [Candidatus Thiodiazotropha endoloripes]MCG7898730.1 hypothetical protein [Candidatus Thiodiazotropha weberae]MCG7901813.1 hypothetical protein [Candidatus Thiodiazotropha weberae]ODB90972.1 hypothetical protein A3195_05945 [Candidatus Thiodiazotropha endoloripes]ODB94405.1 hypothetical protein A3196_17895 [Candidatus Thiodiazotropha endoloripes]